MKQQPSSRKCHMITYKVWINFILPRISVTTLTLGAQKSVKKVKNITADFIRWFQGEFHGENRFKKFSAVLELHVLEYDIKEWKSDIEHTNIFCITYI